MFINGFNRFAYLCILIIFFNEKIYFVANDGVNGYELWTSDGTESGTYILKNINPGNSHAFSQLSNQFIEFDGNFYFFANDGTNIQLWKSNGTTNGTTLFKNVNTFPNNYSYQTASINGAATDDFFVFKAYDYNSSNYQYTEKLMKSDGTIEGTLELLELNSNYSPFSDSQLDRIQNKIYFTTESTYPNKELWVTDGTSQGTNFVTDGYQEFSYFKSEGNNLFLKAKISHNEFQVLKVDYNSNSSSIFLENTINPERGFEIFNGEIYFGFDFNYFNNYHPSGSELWKSNLAGNNPILVEDINTAAPADPTNFANFFNGSTVFNANNYLSYGLYSISTSNELTFLGESYMFQGDGYDSEFYRVGDYYYFNVVSSALNYDLTGLCRTDGTAEGTIKVGNVHVADHMKYNRNYFTHLNDDLYFLAIDGDIYSNKSKIWRTNATNNQTNILVDFTENSNNYTVFNSVIEFNNKIYFAGGIFEPPSHDIVLKGLWSYNPIGENTELIYEPEMTYWDDTGRIEIIGINEGILYFYNIQRTSGNTVTTHFYSLDSEDNIALLGSFNGRVLNSFYYNKFIISNGYFYLPFSDLNINKITLIELGLNHISLLTVEDSNSSTDINSIMSCGNNLYFLETSNYGLWSMSNENEFTLLNGEFDVEAISDLNCYNNELLLYAKTFYPENAVAYSELIVTNGNIEDTQEIIINVDSDFDQIKIEDIFIDNQNKIFFSLSDHYTGAELYVSELDIILTTEEINDGLTKDNSNVLIYPNPTSSEINVVSNDQSQIKQIQLYDLTGKLMEIGIYNSEEVKLNLNKYNSGIYLLKVQTEKNTTTKKVILK